MALQNEKIVVIFYATGNQKIRPSGKIKESILHEETSGYQSVVYFLPSVSGCYLAQLLLISIKSVLILLPINSFINRITLRFWRIIACPYSFMVPIFGGRRWTVFSTAILIIPCVWLGIAVQNRILLLGYLSLSLCYAVLQVRTLLRAWAISVSSFQKPNKGALLGLMAD